MTNDDLRALADALSVPHRDLATVDVIRAADYLRAQADAQPVAWRSKIEGKTKDYWIIQQSEWLAREQPAWEPLYTAPVAPHHAMLDSHRRLVEQAIQTAEHPSGMSTHDGKARIDASVLRRMLSIIDSLPAAPQAEPKREPLSDEQIEAAYWEFDARKKGYGQWKGCPMTDRDAFKWALRAALAAKE